jgi:hypothetical protein
MFKHGLDSSKYSPVLPAIICTSVILLAAAIMLSGCGVGGLAAVAAITGGDGGSGTPFLPSPNNIPTVFVTTPARQVGDVTISYRLIDIDADNCSVTITYGVGGADPVNPATPALTSPPTVDLASSDSGVDHTFIWDSAADLGNGLVTDVRIAAVASDGKDNSTTQTTGDFVVGNDAPVIEVQTPAGEQSGDVGIIYTAKDSSSDLVSIEVEFRPDNSSAWASAAAVGGVATVSLMTAPDPGIQHVFLWDSLDNVGGVGSVISDTCRIRVRLSDQNDTGGWVESGQFTIHNDFPPSASIIDIGTPGLITHRGVIPIGFRLHDAEGDPVDALLEWSDGVTGWHEMTEYPFGSGSIEFSDGTTGLPTPVGGGGIEYTLHWHSLADLDKDLPYVRIRLTPSDPYQSGTPVEVLFNSEISNHAFAFDEVTDLGTRINVISGDFDNNGHDDLVTSLSDIDNCAYYPCGPSGFMSSGKLIPSASALFGLAVGDFDNDGIVDLAIDTDAGPTEIWVYYGQDGTGLDNNSYTILTLPNFIGHLIAADMNDDGIDDLVADCQDAKVYIFEALHASSLDSARRTELQTPHCYGIAKGDVNGDNVTDLVGTSYSVDKLYVWLGNSGYYPDTASRMDFSTLPDEHPEGMKVGDISGDGIDDIITGHFMSPNMSYWLGTPVLGPDNNSRAILNTIDNFSGIVIADMNLDGTNDIVLRQTFGVNMRIYACDTLGPNPAGVNDYTFRESPGRAIAADVLDDGVENLLISFSREGVYIYSPGENQFPDPDSYLLTPCENTKLVTGDFTGTGTVGFTTNDQDSKTGIKFLQDQCGFVDGASYDIARKTQGGIAGIIDYDGDGVNDLFATQTGTTTGISFYKGLPGAGPEKLQTSFVEVPMVLSPITPGDYNGDGKLDVAFSCYNNETGAVVMLGNGSGDLSQTTNLYIPAAHRENFGFQAGDFDNDGITDIAVWNGYLEKIGYFAGRPGVGPALDCTSEMYPVSGGRVMRKGDFNGDSIEDIAVAAMGDNSAKIYFGEHGVGLTNSNDASRQVGGFPFDMVVADFNVDGYDDFVTADFGTDTCTYYKGGPAGPSLTADQTLNVPGGAPFTVVSGDFNADGYTDLAVGCSAENAAYIFPGTPGDGLKDGTGTKIDMLINTRYLISGDINADGIDDVLGWNWSDQTICYLFGRERTGPRNNTCGLISSPGQVGFPNIKDLNSDGLYDLLFSGSNNTLRLFLSHPGRQTSTFRLTTDGGTFNARRRFGAVTLTVPAGAVTDNVDIVILHPVKRELPNTPSGTYRAISKRVAIMRESLSLAQNASLTIPISSGVNDADWIGANNSKVYVLRHERESDSWVECYLAVNAIDDIKREVTLSIERFGYYIVALKQ